MVCALMKKTPAKTVIQEIIIIIIIITIIKCELAVWLSDYHYPIYLNRFTKDTLEKLHCSAAVSYTHLTLPTKLEV